MSQKFKPRAKAFWKLELYFECPACNDFTDYLSTDDCSDGGFESLPKEDKVDGPFRGGECEIKCGQCGAEIILDIQAGL